MHELHSVGESEYEEVGSFLELLTFFFLTLQQWESQPWQHGPWLWSS